MIENVKYLMDDSMITWYLERIKDTVWPNGVMVTSWPTRSILEKKACRSEALRKIQIYTPDLLGGMVGRGNARRGARKLFEGLQDRSSNERLALDLLMVGLDAVFPEVDWEQVKRSTSSHN
jgi:sorting nexin-25